MYLADLERNPPRLGVKARSWTAQEDAMLVRMRNLGDKWENICKLLKVSEETARRRYNYLKAGSGVAQR